MSVCVCVCVMTCTNTPKVITLQGLRLPLEVASPSNAPEAAVDTAQKMFLHSFLYLYLSFVYYGAQVHTDTHTHPNTHTHTHTHTHTPLSLPYYITPKTVKRDPYIKETFPGHTCQHISPYQCRSP